MPILAVFGPPRLWPDEDVIGFSDIFDADLVLAAYRSGVFPMPLHGAFFGPGMAWWSPLRRGVLELRALQISRSLRQSAKHFDCTVNQAFDAVLDRCADAARPGYWIDADIRRVYGQLHDQGQVVSVETWTKDGRLAGGLYGVSLGGLFAGESMFHDPEIGRDASKVALVHLIEHYLAVDDVPRLVDVQWSTPHLASLGVTEIPRSVYLARLAAVIDQPTPVWPARPPRAPVVRADGAPRRVTGSLP
jgi:leucyl/phenylalanyl-tRNA--protein transferase